MSIKSLYELFISAEALHIGSLVAAQGYIFPISDHVLILKDDSTFYRFQVSNGINVKQRECRTTKRVKIIK